MPRGSPRGTPPDRRRFRALDVHPLARGRRHVRGARDDPPRGVAPHVDPRRSVPRARHLRRRVHRARRGRPRRLGEARRRRPLHHRFESCRRRRRRRSRRRRRPRVVARRRRVPRARRRVRGERVTPRPTPRMAKDRTQRALRTLPARADVASPPPRTRRRGLGVVRRARVAAQPRAVRVADAHVGVRRRFHRRRRALRRAYPRRRVALRRAGVPGGGGDIAPRGGRGARGGESGSAGGVVSQSRRARVVAQLEHARRQPPREESD